MCLVCPHTVTDLYSLTYCIFFKVDIMLSDSVSCRGVAPSPQYRPFPAHSVVLSWTPRKP